MSDPWAVGGATALQRYAPHALAAFNGLVAAWPVGVTEAQLAAIRTVTAEGLGLAPLRLPATGPRSSPLVPDPEAMELPEQFAVDVSEVTEAQRAAWLRTVGAAAYEATFTVWVADYVPRVRAALDALFGADSWFDVGLTPTHHARLMMDEFLREVAILDTLDPVATELVRLRGARQHHCRLCMSRRSLDAMRAGADAATFEALDRYRSSSIAPAHRAALGLTDAIIWMPAHLRPQDIAAARLNLTPAQAVELVLDVMRNAANKIAVALGADHPEAVGGAIQLFETDAEGGMHFP